MCSLNLFRFALCSLGCIFRVHSSFCSFFFPLKPKPCLLTWLSSEAILRAHTGRCQVIPTFLQRIIGKDYTRWICLGFRPTKNTHQKTSDLGKPWKCEKEGGRTNKTYENRKKGKRQQETRRTPRKAKENQRN